jgi:hypothetical protein
MRNMLVPALLLILAATLEACSDGPAGQSDLANYYPDDPPPFYSESAYGQPQVLGHPYGCRDCGWSSWGER